MKRNSLLSRVGWFVVLAMVAALTPQTVRAVDGSETVVGGGVIEFTGASQVSRVGTDLLLKFTNTTETGSVKLPGLTQMRILAVGGGGGGAGANKSGFKGDYGSGGGGGGGGVLETNDLFSAAKLTISVGKGGDAGSIGTSASSWPGKNGGDTTVAIGETPILKAYGGGGGNGHGQGLAGASGGGSSRSTSETFLGGKVLPEAVGQGYPGGAGDAGVYGGGGGGAGGAGANASTGNPIGGVGRKSDITGEKVDNEDPYYGGGGGGSHGDQTVTTQGLPAIAGGKGGGGQGGVGTKTFSTAGTPGTGGGGGGSRAWTTGKAGAGGSGVVFVRISAAISGALDKPADQTIVHDGETHVVVQEMPFYTITGDREGREIGTYLAKVKPNEGITWTDGTTNEVTVMLAITTADSLSGLQVVPGGGSVLFAGAVATNWIWNPVTGESDFLIKFMAESKGSFKLPGRTKARVLAVGGGGGGAGANKSGFKSPYGSGAGGGAGGMLEVTNILPAAVYAVNVGAGGAAGTIGASSASWSGGNGGDTTINRDGEAWLTAFGGGGGAGHGIGLSGGSGGGGSQLADGTPQAGGSVLNAPAAQGQGNAGGAGDAAVFGGGGGGAGGPGANASTENPTGGIGRQSDITGEKVEGEDPYYAGGGAGGHGDQKITTAGLPAIVGGRGGGGNGGVGTKVYPTAGADGTGGGGGGCRAWTTGKAGSGGSGVVYVRISMSFNGDIEKPKAEQSYPYDGNAHTSVVESAAYTIEGDTVGTDVGTYKAKVVLMKGLVWRGGGDEDVNVTMEITKSKAEIVTLVQKNWMYGTPSAVVPKPICEISLPGVTATYEYADTEDGEYSTTIPTEVGTHWLRATVAGTANYDGDVKKVPFEIEKGLGDTFTDYVEITIDAYTGTNPSVLTNYPYRLTLSEAEPNGFLYSRAGSTGKGLAFTDKNGTVLPYEVGKWDVDGVSYLYVRIPYIGNQEQVIRLYWSVRPGSVAPASHPELVWTDWSKEDWEKITDPPGRSYSFVSRNGYKVNFWKVRPEMTKTIWDERDPEPGTLKVQGQLMYGQPEWHYASAYDPSVIYGQTMPTTGGAYRIVWEYVDPAAEYEPFEDHIDFTIFGHNAIDVFGDEVETTLSGRVMLVNDDDAEGHKVDYQSYWHVRETDGKINDLFWVHTGTHDNWDDYINTVPGTSHALYYVNPESNKTNLLWHFENALIGNTLVKGQPVSAVSGKCFLPWSTTSRVSHQRSEDDYTNSCNIVLRNMVGAAIYSPIYTNGIGTIYFDAVNANTSGVNDDAYRFRVEIATGKTIDDIRDIPEESWRPVSMLPLKRDQTDYFVACPETESLSLDIKNAKSTNNFYRICANVESRGVTRFRIIRETFKADTRADYNIFILIDNIIVSYPRSTGELKPYGRYESAFSGKQVLGQEAATTVPFPAVNGVNVYGRGLPEVFVNPQNTVPTDQFISYAKMLYRWRYLGQDSNAWDSVELWPGNKFVSTKALRLPDREGDIEFRYEVHTQVPYYRYYDYSGLGVGIDPGLYTEDKPVVTNVMSFAARGGKTLPSAGTDWFFRLRAGRSFYEGYRLYAKFGDGSIKAYDMELISDGTWRGYFPTRKDQAGEVQVRIEALNRQETGETEFQTNTGYYRFYGNATIVPWAMTSLVAATDENEWSTVKCDASTGYLMFQLEETSRGVSVVHADYQNFNAWNDANRKDGQGIFVGTSADTNSVYMSGSGSETHEYEAAMDYWHLSCPTSKYWSEAFAVEPDQMGTGKPWETYKPFASARTPNGLTAGNGMWVTGNYRDTSTGMAYQMAGKGNGYLQFINAAEMPRGIESVSFNARLGQSIGFDDFCYYDGGEKPKMTNYTFVTRAAYDLTKRQSFSGNASLSLVAGYRPGVGCYEFRVEQQNAKFKTGSTTQVEGAGNKHRLSLHRWRYDANTGEFVDTELGSVSVDNGSTLITDKARGNYSAMFISYEVTATETRVAAGLSRDMASVNTFPSTAAFSWVWFTDKSDDRLDKGGTYGVLSANCPGRFVAPVTFPKATSMPDSNTGFRSNLNRNFTYQSTKKSCQDDLGNGNWNVPPWRMAAFDDKDNYYFGIDATIFSQPLEVYTAPVGTDQWTLLLSTNITTYGSPGDKDKMTFNLWTKDECAVRLASGSSGKSERNGIVIDDLIIRQWRGESYDDAEGAKYFPIIGYGSPTNFVFTQAWISTNELAATNCQLCAKRAKPEVATSIRSPLLDGNDGRGIGLGMLSFTYANAGPNVNLLLQIATNDVDITSLPTVSKSVSKTYWTTLTNYNFATFTEEQRKSGQISYYIGLHGVKGLMRLVMDPEVVKATESVRDPAMFGTIEINSMICRDEPQLDETSWWGWNIRTTDELDKMNLVDFASDPVWHGMSFGLNNSVTEDIRKDDIRQAALYPEHLPFLQTPTFQKETVGQVSFRARKYLTSDMSARLTLYGAKEGVAEFGTDAEWTPLESWLVTNTLFEAFSHKTKVGDNYTAFRFVVTGVEGVKHPTMPQETFPTTPCARVLVDEVLVMEAVRATVAFRNVAAFRTGLDSTLPVMNIMDRSQQPLCREAWGVQAEIYAAQLADEIDLSNAKVRLWWYDSVAPWGFAGENGWKARGKSAWLTPCEGTNNVFKSTYFGSPGAVMDAQPSPITVQYMLEVVYNTTRGETVTNWLDTADWQVPAWYNPVNYNVRYGGSFSAFNILDTVSPGWAWVNEVNIFGEMDLNYENSDKPQQFVEIAAPADADLTNWTLRFLYANSGSGTIVTNDVATFGTDGLPGVKAGYKGKDEESDCVFHVIGSPYALTSKYTKRLTVDDGTLDGVWRIRTATSATYTDGEIQRATPFGVQLVRPSGVVAHEIVAIGTNRWEYLGGDYIPETQVALMNEDERRRGGQGLFFSAGMDAAGIGTNAPWSASLGVTRNNGLTAMDWNGTMGMTPGRRNEFQDISGRAPKPQGTSMIIYAQIDGDHLVQTFSDAVATNLTVAAVVPKGTTTNITYWADRWYEVGTVTTNGVPVPVPASGVVTVGGKCISNDFTVVARAQIDSRLANEYGLGPDNRYREAVMNWLTKGTTKRGAFANVNTDGFVGLAEFHRWHDEKFVTNLTLTTMYWLDMDPTWNKGDLWLKGYISAPNPIKMAGLENRRMTVYMMITNTVPTATDRAWAPYILQGQDPGSSSWDYALSGSSWTWSNATFKVTGLLVLDTKEGDFSRNNWLPLRSFVFTGSGNGVSASFDSSFGSIIDIVDPHSTESPGYRYGWGDHPEAQIWHRWDLDNRLVPMGVEILRPSNTYNWQ